MPKQVKRLSDLRRGQRIVTLAPVQRWTVKEPGVTSMTIANGTDERYISAWWLEAGIFVGNGPCRPCEGNGIVRIKESGEWKQCKVCYGGWLI